MTPVTSASSDVVGQRYYLPKPVIQVAPQQNGTVAVSVLYLPDTSHAYAVDAHSWLSAYSLQVLPNPDGTLNGVYYQGNTTAAPQQLAATTGSLATQVANYHLSQATAQQTAVATAQTAVDTAQAAADAANAALASDLQANAANPSTPPVKPETIAGDQSTAAQAAAKLAIAKQTLQRVQSQAVLPSAPTLTAAGVVTTDASPAADSGFTAAAGTWTAPTSVNLPGAHAAMLYMLNDKIDPDTKAETVSLSSAISINGAKAASPLPDFPVSYTGLGPPVLLAPTDPFAAGGDVTLKLSRPILAMASVRVLTGSPAKIVAVKALSLDPGKQTLKIDTTGLAAGTYKIALTVTFMTNGKAADARSTNVSTSFVLQ